MVNTESALWQSYNLVGKLCSRTRPDAGHLNHTALTASLDDSTSAMKLFSIIISLAFAFCFLLLFCCVILSTVTSRCRGESSFGAGESRMRRFSNGRNRKSVNTAYPCGCMETVHLPQMTFPFGNQKITPCYSQISYPLDIPVEYKKEMDFAKEIGNGYKMNRSSAGKM